MTCSSFLPEALYWGVQLLFCPVGLERAPDLASATAVHSRGSAAYQGVPQSTVLSPGPFGNVWKQFWLSHVGAAGVAPSNG